MQTKMVFKQKIIYFLNGDYNNVNNKTKQNKKARGK